MRIIHTCLRYPPATGGAETYIQQLVERTRDISAKRDVRVLTSAMRTHGPISYLKPEDLRDDPVYVQRLSVGKTPILSYPRLEALQYYLGHHQPDIIHGYGFWYQPADTSARYAKKHHVPLFLHPMYYENAIRRKLAWQIYKKTIGARTFEQADIVIVLSPFEKQLITDAGFSVKRFEIVPPGIDASRFLTPRPNPFLKRGIKGYIVLAINRLSPGKKLEDAVLSLAQIVKHEPNAQLVLVGEDFGSRKDIAALAKAQGVESHVHFLGKLSDTELNACYQHANVFVHTSQYEAFGIVVADALAAGLPVIARNTSAIPHLVPQGKHGLLFNTTQELTAHLLTYIKNPEHAKGLAKAGQARIASEFTWDNSMNKLLKLYAEFSK